VANKEHLDILKQGVEVWNEWRKENPFPDLIDADLRGVRACVLHGRSGLQWTDHGYFDSSLLGATLNQANFRHARLVGTNLHGARLRGADFGSTSLYGAKLRYADLTDANLTGAQLNSADFTGAILVDANLRDAQLHGAMFDRTNLYSTNFEKAMLDGTTFARVDLSRARGLETCQHKGPGSIDVATLSHSRDLPIEFLRGCGLPDFIIDNIPVLQGDPIQFYSCFISYSTENQDFAARLYADLQNKGIRCWFAPADMKIGDPIRKTIYDQIRVYEKLLLIFSEESVESEWVGDEVEAAFEEEKRCKRLMLFPIRLDEVVMETDNDWAAKIRRTRHIGNFTNWKDHDAYQEAFDRLIRDLKQEAEKGGKKE